MPNASSTPHFEPKQRLRVEESVGLGGDDHAGDGSRGQGGKDTRDQCRQGQSGDITTSLGCKFSKNTDLNTQRTNVSETAACVGSDELRSGGKAGVGGVGGESAEGNILVLLISTVLQSKKKETHGDDLLGNQSSDQQQIVSFSTDTQEESDRVEAVSKDGL
jgi:hypothetical protein